MSVKPAQLETPERGMNLSTREAPEVEPSRLALRDRLEKARALKPAGTHWWECWKQGRDVAIAAIEVSAGDTAAARAIQTPAVIGCGDCFRKGRDAVIHFIESA